MIFWYFPCYFSLPLDVYGSVAVPLRGFACPLPVVHGGGPGQRRPCRHVHREAIRKDMKNHVFWCLLSPSLLRTSNSLRLCIVDFADFAFSCSIFLAFSCFLSWRALRHATATHTNSTYLSIRCLYAYLYTYCYISLRCLMSQYCSAATSVPFKACKDGPICCFQLSTLPLPWRHWVQRRENRALQWKIATYCNTDIGWRILKLFAIKPSPSFGALEGLYSAYKSDYITSKWLTGQALRKPFPRHFRPGQSLCLAFVKLVAAYRKSLFHHQQYQTYQVRIGKVSPLTLKQLELVSQSHIQIPPGEVLSRISTCF